MDATTSNPVAKRKGVRCKKLLSADGIPKMASCSMVTPVLQDVGKLAACVAAVSTKANSSNLNATTSSTGNLRNKFALQPGHSLMDWIRLGYSGQDLTGVGALAGQLTVTSEELQMHNKRHDAWIAIRGNVYNVTSYIDYHPGGADELMRGIGLPDATLLFDKVHPWVNYDKMLAKCFIGRTCVSNPSLKVGSNLKVKQEKAPTCTEKEQPISRQLNEMRRIRHDWIQKLDDVVLCFYTWAYTNPFLEIHRPKENDNTFAIVITIREIRHSFAFTPNKCVHWPPHIKIYQESGKITVQFKKYTSEIWPTCGTIQVEKSASQLNTRREFIVSARTELNSRTFMLSVRNTDGILCNTPIAHHLLLYNDVNEGREFTPVPNFYLPTTKEDDSTELVSFIIRRYPEGCLSDYLYKKEAGDAIEASQPISCFNLQLIENHEHFVFIAGGVGVTPMLSILQFLLVRKMKPALSIVLMLFNPTQEHQFLEEKFSSMTHDQRFRFVSIVTRPTADYDGPSGHISDQLIQSTLGPDILMTEVFYFVCGPFATTRYVTVLIQK